MSPKDTKATDPLKDLERRVDQLVRDNAHLTQQVTDLRRARDLAEAKLEGFREGVKAAGGDTNGRGPSYHTPSIPPWLPPWFGGRP